MKADKKAAPGANRAASSSAFDGEIIAEIQKNSRESYRVVRPGRGVSLKLEVMPEIVAALSELIDGGRR